MDRNVVEVFMKVASSIASIIITICFLAFIIPRPYIFDNISDIDAVILMALAYLLFQTWKY